MTKSPSSRPLSIKVIAFSYLGLAVADVLRIIYASTSSVILVPETTLVIQALLSPALYGCIALGLWRLLNPVRLIAVAHLAYFLLGNLGLLIARMKPVIEVIRAAILHGSETYKHFFDPLTTLSIFINVGFVLGCSAAIWFLIIRRAAFGKSPLPT